MSFTSHELTSSTTVNTLCSSAATHAGVRPPPTYNHLDPAQRLRLIRSTRKLGKVLGTTPCILEPIPPMPTSSASVSTTDMAKKRCSAPPTPTSSYGDFLAATPTSSSCLRSNRSRRISHGSVSDREDESNSARPYLTEPSPLIATLHRKASSEGLAPTSLLPDSDTARQKPKRAQQQQPVFRLPPIINCNAMRTTPREDSFPSPSSSSFKIASDSRPDAVGAPLPQSPTSPVSPTSSGLPPTPPDSFERSAEEESDPLPDDVFAYPGLKTRSTGAGDESRLRKRRMEKLMRHLGECVPSELVFGSSRARGGTSISNVPMSPPPPESASTATGRIKDAQAKVFRRVSVISGHRKRDRTNAEDNDIANLGCLSEPESGHSARIHAVLMREKNFFRVARRNSRDNEVGRGQPLVEDDWTPEAYEDIVKRLRRLK